MVLNLKFTPSALKGEQALDKLVSLVKTYFGLGGFQVQINVVGRETLEDARVHPERHRGLIVRVGGYSDYFTALDPTLQDEIIRRTEHGG
jgi:formate C-acetyltransferase